MLSLLGCLRDEATSAPLGCKEVEEGKVLLIAELSKGNSYLGILSVSEPNTDTFFFVFDFCFLN